MGDQTVSKPSEVMSGKIWPPWSIAKFKATSPLQTSAPYVEYIRLNVRINLDILGRFLLDTWRLSSAGRGHLSLSRYVP